MRFPSATRNHALSPVAAPIPAPIRLVLEATSGMYGDLQGIAGTSLEKIEALGDRLLLAESN